MSKTVRVAVTGAAGQVAYSMLARLASGEVFGPDTQVVLQLLEIPQAPCKDASKASPWNSTTVLFPTLKDIVLTDDPNKAFDGVNWALLVGSFPRKAGMERSELLGINGKIFVGQGKALAAKAASDVRIVVVGNPCNTNCLVAYTNGQGHSRRALDRADAARSQPRPERAGEEGRRRQRRRDQHDHLGQPLRDAVPRLHQRARSAASRPRR